MASVAGRKKSIVSSTGFQIDQPVANNTLLNKAASQSTSLYQQCSALRADLLRIEGFSQYFSRPDSRSSTDPVTQIWDVFALGQPLCYLYNKLSDYDFYDPIDLQELADLPPEKASKRAIALFSMRVKKMLDAHAVEGCEIFAVRDVLDRESTDGLVRVLKTVTAVVKMLPQEAFDAALPSPPFMSTQASTDSLPSEAPNARETARNNIIREMVETERKYVQDLEVMQNYANALAQGNVIDQDTIHLLFPNLNKLLNFQRKFLIRLEGIAELPWPEQRWGLLFLDSEEEFVVYEPYCANYTMASELMLANEQNLAALNHLINVKGELPAFLIKPVQRVCKYPLLLDSLIKAASPDDYLHYEELKSGSVAAKRITDKINEAQRRAENDQTVQSLAERVEDWKGHHLSNFGELLLDDIFVVTKSEVDREYHVFLFEKIILCCKEALPPASSNGKKGGKTNSLRKQFPPPPPPLVPGQPQKRNTPLLLKGRIFLNNVTKAVPANPRNSTSSSIPTQYPLAVWWRGDDDLEFFTLRCRGEDQRRQWETAITRLIKEVTVRRQSERGMSRLASTVSSQGSHPSMRQPSASFSHHAPASSDVSQPYLSTLPSNPAASRSRRSSPYGHEDYVPRPTQSNGYPSGPHGYPPHEGFEFEPDEDDYEDYPPVNNYASSGRGTPVGSRRNNAMSMPPERDPMQGYDRSRALTEDANGALMAQWRANGVPPSNGLRPITPRLNSAASVNSYASESSFGSGVNNSQRPRPQLRSQFSQTRLRSGYDSQPPSNGLPPPPINRSRSASQPATYVPKTMPPPLPSTQWAARSGTSMSTSKRGSGSSESTGDSSEYSPNSSSPITPFGSSESSLGGVMRNGGMNGHGSGAVKIKVHFNEDIFVIQVPRYTDYDELLDKVGKKIRLCGPRRDDGPLRVKYRDEDGDMISLGSTEDVQMAFEHYRPGTQVILFVQ